MSAVPVAVHEDSDSGSGESVEDDAARSRNDAAFRFKQKVIHKLHGRSSSSSSSSFEEDYQDDTLPAAATDRPQTHHTAGGSNANGSTSASSASLSREEVRAGGHPVRRRLRGPAPCPPDYTPPAGSTDSTQQQVGKEDLSDGDDEASGSTQHHHRRPKRRHRPRHPAAKQDTDSSQATTAADAAATVADNNSDVGSAGPESGLTKNKKRKLKKKRRQKEKRVMEEAKETGSSSVFTFDEHSQNNSASVQEDERLREMDELSMKGKSVCEFLQGVWSVYHLQDAASKTSSANLMGSVEEYLGHAGLDSLEEVRRLHTLRSRLMLPGLPQALRSVAEFLQKTSLSKDQSQFLEKLLTYWATDVMNR